MLTIGALENEALDRLMAAGRAGNGLGKTDLLEIALAVAPEDYDMLLGLAADYPFLGTTRARLHKHKASPVQLIRANLVAHLLARMAEHLELLARNGNLPWRTE